MNAWLKRQERWAKPAGYIAGFLLAAAGLLGYADALATSYVHQRAVSREELRGLVERVDALYNVILKQECPNGN